MPEHNSAATEHALIHEITAPLQTIPDDPIRLAADVNFPVVLRGYDRIAVDAYVKKASQLVAELQSTRSPEAAVRRALERVGEEVSGILQRAHETAERITAQSRAEAEDRVEVARQEAADIKVEAENRLKELDLETDRIWEERHRIVSDIRRLADQLQELAGAAAARFPEEPVAAPEMELALEPAAELDHAAELKPEPPAERAMAAASDPRVIDLMHLGRERVIGCWQVEDVLIDPGPGSCVETLLDALGGGRPRALLLTHIHLDHAGASGALVRLWPDLEVYVHERGARHLADPSRLLESARRLYGEDMDRLWGEMLPVPEAQLRILKGGEVLEGGFEVAYTPGHASHHVSFLHDGTAFVGDVGGVRITASTLTVPPTPPPDIDLEAWNRSLELIRAWRPQRLAMTHFGASEDVEGQLSELAQRLDAWAELARESDAGTFMAEIRAEIAQDAGPALAATYEQAAPADQLYAGLERYWRKRAESEPPTQNLPLS